MRQVSMTIGHKVGAEERWTTASICEAVTTILGLEAFTAIPVLGMWRGQAEASTRIEVVCDERTASSIEEELPFLAHMLGQEAIMCESRASAAEFVPALVTA